MTTNNDDSRFIRLQEFDKIIRLLIFEDPYYKDPVPLMKSKVLDNIYPAGFEHILEELWERARTLYSEEHHILFFMLMAHCHLRMGDYKQAQFVAEIANESFLLRGDRINQALSHWYTGLLLLNQGNLYDARKNLLEAHEVISRITSDDEELRKYEKLVSIHEVSNNLCFPPEITIFQSLTSKLDQ